jgi:hypothetical protein
LPNITLHHTEESVRQDENPILLGDAALRLRPLDIEARQLAKWAETPESNVLYRAGQLFNELEPQRTWLVDGLPLEPNRLRHFLEEADLRFDHNLPKIAPARAAVSRVAAELYDSGRLPRSRILAVTKMLSHSDTRLIWLEPEPRPLCIERIGDLDYEHPPYIEVPKDWLSTTASSLALLSQRSHGGLVIMGEWTRLKRLDRKWPAEERMSWLRLGSPDQLGDMEEPEDEELPFAQTRNAFVSDYQRLNDFPITEVVIANNGYGFQNDAANWLGFNPTLGAELGWRLAKDGWFRWVNQHDEIMAESVWWEDGPFDLSSYYDHVEVGNGWLVLMTNVGYDHLRQRFPQITRAGKVRRSLGWLGSAGQQSAFSLMNTA